MKIGFRTLVPACLGVVATTMVVTAPLTAVCADEHARQRHYEFKWLDNNKILVYSYQSDPPFILVLPSGQLHPLAYSTREKSLSLSSRGERTVVYDELKEFRFGDASGPLSRPVKIPLWLPVPAGEDLDKYLSDNIENRFFWLSDKALLLNQRDRESGEVVCKPFDTVSGQWQAALAHCIDTQTVNINDIQYNFDSHILIIDGSVEGAQEINVALWAGEKGAKNAKFPILDLTNGIVKIGFNQEPDSLWLMSPCTLSDTAGKPTEQPCKGVVPESSSWNHYQWSLKTPGRISQVRSKLPINSTPRNAGQAGYVWINGAEVCEGDPAVKSKIRCKPLP